MSKQAGKGSLPSRNNFSEDFRKGYDEINWGGVKKKEEPNEKGEKTKAKRNGSNK